MTINEWMEVAAADAERRDLAALRPLLEALARSMSALRAADWIDDGSPRVDESRTPDVG
jgi:hypothetical protein